MSKDFFRDLVEEIKDEDTTIAADGLGSAEFGGYIDTGSYILNALVSGSLYGGIPDNKVVGLAGEQATGKTFFILGLTQHFLAQHEGAGAVYYDTEGAVTREMMSSRGLDPGRVIVSEPVTVQDFKFKSLKMLDAYLGKPEKKRPRLIFVLDSLGQLPTAKEMEDSAAGNDTRDMTRAQMIKSAFRVLTLKCAKAKVPLLVANHTYDKVGSYIPGKEIGGGGGLKYAASIILTLTKSKEKDEDNTVSGAVVRVTTYKSRLTRENQSCKTLITFDKGLDRYYGLIELAEKYGIFKKVGKKYEVAPGVEVFEKEILRNPTKYYTPEVMAALEKAAAKEFLYGTTDEKTSDEEV